MEDRTGWRGIERSEVLYPHLARTTKASLGGMVRAPSFSAREVTPGFYAIGRITKSSGLKGEVAVQPLTDFPARFHRLKEVWIETGSSHPQPYQVEKVLVLSRTVRIQLEGVRNRVEGDTLVGKFLLVTEENRIQPRKGTYFIHDIIGSEAMNEEGRKIGIVREVWRLPANDVYVIRDGQREYLIPAVQGIIRDVNTEKKRIKIQTIEGLLQ